MDLPIDRDLSLCGGFSLGTVVAIARLAAMMAFAPARQTFAEFHEWMPSSRAALRMVDSIGGQARPFLEQAPPPEEDGEILVIQVDARGAPMITNKRVIGTFGTDSELMTWLRREADKRGYGEKRTLFLADGSPHTWREKAVHFPEAEGCIDWYHIAEEFWEAGRFFHREDRRRSPSGSTLSSNCCARASRTPARDKAPR